MSWIYIIIFSIAALFGVENRFEATPFNTVSVEDIDLGRTAIIEDLQIKLPSFVRTGKRKFTFSMNREQREYYNSLSENDKRIMLKIITLDVLKDISQKKFVEQYSYVYKKKRGFNLETISILPMTYEESYPIIVDYADYPNWVLRDINFKRDGSGEKYFVDIDSMAYHKLRSMQFFDTRVTLHLGAKGKYRMDLLILDHTRENPVPYFTLKMRDASPLTKSLSGTFRFFSIPGCPYVVTYFTGRSELSWLLYKFLPLALVRSQVTERIDTLLENIQYKAERAKQSKKAQKGQKTASRS